MRTALAHKAPERIVKGYLKEMKDQWNGATFSFDLGLVGSDVEMSGAIWRNVFASRGLDGKGEVVGKPGKTSLEPRAVEASASASPSAAQLVVEDPSSSTVDSPTTLSDAALSDLPFHLYIFTAYIRRELRRLEALSDEDVIAGRMGSFGSFESHVRAAERDFMMEKEERSLLGLEDDIPSAGVSARPDPASSSSSHIGVDGRVEVPQTRGEGSTESQSRSAGSASSSSSSTRRRAASATA